MAATTYLESHGAKEGVGKDVQKTREAGGKPVSRLEEAEACVSELRLLRSGLLSVSDKSMAAATARAASLQRRAAEVLDTAATAAEERAVAKGATSVEAQESRAHRMWLRGEGLLSIDDMCPSEDAENLLTRAVKLDPSLLNAWNALAECFWRRGELDLARNCIRRGLERKRTVQGLRMLSMVVREPITSLTIDAANESVALAKEALSLDLDSCQSWECLGNAYLGQFAANDQARLDIVKLAQKAYGKAVSKPEADWRPYLHFNRATSCMWAADFEEALNAYDKVSAIDASRCCDGEKDTVYELLRLLHASVNERGGLKQKRLYSLRAQLRSRAETMSAAGALADLDAGRNATTLLWCVVLADVEDIQNSRSGPGISWKLAVSHDEIFFVLCCYGSSRTSMLRPGTAATISGAILGRVFTNKGNEVFDFPFVQIDIESSIKVHDSLQA